MVNTKWEPGPVNTNWGRGSRAEERAGEQEIQSHKADSDVNMKQDLSEFDFQLRLSDGLVEQTKPLH